MMAAAARFCCCGLGCREKDENLPEGFFIDVDVESTNEGGPESEADSMFDPTDAFDGREEPLDVDEKLKCGAPSEDLHLADLIGEGMEAEEISRPVPDLLRALPTSEVLHAAGRTDEGAS